MASRTFIVIIFNKFQYFWETFLYIHVSNYMRTERKKVEIWVKEWNRNSVSWHCQKKKSPNFLWEIMQWNKTLAKLFCNKRKRNYPEWSCQYFALFKNSRSFEGSCIRKAYWKKYDKTAATRNITMVCLCRGKVEWMVPMLPLLFILYEIKQSQVVKPFHQKKLRYIVVGG